MRKTHPKEVKIHPVLNVFRMLFLESGSLHNSNSNSNNNNNNNNNNTTPQFRTGVHVSCILVSLVQKASDLDQRRLPSHVWRREVSGGPGKFVLRCWQDLLGRTVGFCGEELWRCEDSCRFFVDDFSQLTINWWFGLVVWIPGIPLRDCYLGVPH